MSRFPLSARIRALPPYLFAELDRKKHEVRAGGVALDAPSELVAVIGSKEGIPPFPLAFVTPGDTVLVPDPGYPVYPIATMFAGGRSHFLPLRRENAFLPDFGAIPRSVLAKAKILFLNYPNNPTSAVAARQFYRAVLGLAEEHHLIVAR